MREKNNKLSCVPFHQNKAMIQKNIRAQQENKTLINKL